MKSISSAIMALVGIELLNFATEYPATSPLAMLPKLIGAFGVILLVGGAILWVKFMATEKS